MALRCVCQQYPCVCAANPDAANPDASSLRQRHASSTTPSTPSTPFTPSAAIDEEYFANEGPDGEGRVRRWLEGLALGEYADGFVAEGLDRMAMVVEELDEATLDTMEVKRVHKARIMRAVGVLRDQMASWNRGGVLDPACGGSGGGSGDEGSGGAASGGVASGVVIHPGGRAAGRCCKAFCCCPCSTIGCCARNLWFCLTVILPLLLLPAIVGGIGSFVVNPHGMKRAWKAGHLFTGKHAMFGDTIFSEIASLFAETDDGK